MSRFEGLGYLIRLGDDGREASESSKLGAIGHKGFSHRLFFYTIHQRNINSKKKRVNIMNCHHQIYYGNGEADNKLYMSLFFLFIY